MRTARKEKSKIMYHIGMQLPIPYPMTKWSASRGLPAKGVFLTPNWREVVRYHHITGHVYAYRVPHEVIRAAGGIKRLDQASEICIPEELWPKVEFLGKVEDYREVARFKLIQVRTDERRYVNDYINAGKDTSGYMKEYAEQGYDFGNGLIELPMTGSRWSGYGKKSPRRWTKRNPQERYYWLVYGPNASMPLWFMSGECKTNLIEATLIGIKRNLAKLFDTKVGDIKFSQGPTDGHTDTLCVKSNTFDATILLSFDPIPNEREDGERAAIYLPKVTLPYHRGPQTHKYGINVRNVFGTGSITAYPISKIRNLIVTPRDSRAEVESDLGNKIIKGTLSRYSSKTYAYVNVILVDEWGDSNCFSRMDIDLPGKEIIMNFIRTAGWDLVVKHIEFFPVMHEDELIPQIVANVQQLVGKDQFYIQKDLNWLWSYRNMRGKVLGVIVLVDGSTYDVLDKEHIPS